MHLYECTPPLTSSTKKKLVDDGSHVDDRVEMDMREGRRNKDKLARNKDMREGRTKEDDNDSRTEKEKKKCERCGQMFKGDLGVKIHQGKKKRCGSTSEACSRGQTLHKTTGDQGQDIHHRANVTQATEGTPPDSITQTDGQQQERQLARATPLPGEGQSRLPRLNLPKASSTEWKDLDEDIDRVLEANLRGPASRKMEKLSTTVYEMCKDRIVIEYE